MPDFGSVRPLLVLHPGPHKTGTTSIQHFLAGNRGAVRLAGLTYPQSSPWEAHHALPAAYMKSHILLPTHVLDVDPRPIWAAMCRESAPSGHMVVSSEAFWELLTYIPEAFDDLLKLMRRTHDVHIVYFMRDADAKAFSAIRHLSREGLPFDPAETYASDIALTERTEAALAVRFDGAHRHRVDYAGGDTVEQFVTALLRCTTEAEERVVGDGGTALREAFARTRAETGTRFNVAPEHPNAAAVTFAVTLGMDSLESDAKGSLPRFYEAVLKDPPVPFPRGLPDDRELRRRLRADAPLITQDEARSVHEWLSDPAVASAARLRHGQAHGFCLEATAALLRAG